MVEVPTCLEKGDEVVGIRGWLGESELDGDTEEDVVGEAAQHGHGLEEEEGGMGDLGHRK